MSFTLSGNTVTQSNDAAKTITGVSAVTGGIRLAITDHGYGIGQVLRVTGTGVYDGYWAISAVPNGSAVDITNQSFDGVGVSPLAFSASATGQAARGDGDLSGLSGIAGVTTWTLSSGAKPITWYVLPSTMRLSITGLLRIPRGNVLVMQGTSVSNGRIHTNGGDLWIDKRLNRFGGFSFQQEDAILFTGANGTGGSSWGNPPDALLHLDTGTFTQWGGRCVIPGAIRVNSGIGAVRLRTAIWDGDLNVLTDNDVPVWYVTSNLPAWDVIGWDIIRGKFEFAGSNPAATNFKGVRIIASNRGFSTGASVPDGTWFDLFGVTAIDSKCGISVLFRRRLRAFNSPRVPVISADTSGGTGGLVEQRHKLNVTLTDAAGTILPGAKVCVTDTNSGARRNWTETNPAGIYNQTLTYSATANGSGVAALDLLTYVNQIIGPNTLTQWFEDNRFAGDIATLAAVGYRTQVTYRTHNTALGTPNGDDFSYTIPMLADPMIAEQNSSAVAAYTDITTAARLYDRLKLWLVDNYAGQSNPFSIVDGKVNLGSYNLVINPTAAAPLAVAGATITIKAGAFTGALVTTGTITLQNGSIVSGSMQDSTADSQASIILPSGYDTVTLHSTSADADTGANVLFAGNTTVRYLSAQYAGQTVWLRVTSASMAGAEIIVPQLVPSAPGVYTFIAAQFGESRQLAEIRAALTVLNRGVQRASLLLPHTEVV